MKGIVFTEFLDLVENKFGLTLLDELLQKSSLESGGIYTSVGTYNHAEMVELVTNLSELVSLKVEDLLMIYGEHFFSVLHSSYPGFFENMNSCLDFFQAIETYIHPQVLKLYPDAELPRFENNRIDENTLEMLYTSNRKMSAFAHGLMRSTIDHFEEIVEIEIKQMSSDGTKVLFTLIKYG